MAHASLGVLRTLLCFARDCSPPLESRILCGATSLCELASRQITCCSSRRFPATCFARSAASRSLNRAICCRPRLRLHRIASRSAHRFLACAQTVSVQITTLHLNGVRRLGSYAFCTTSALLELPFVEHGSRPILANTDRPPPASPRPIARSRSFGFSTLHRRLPPATCVPKSSELFRLARRSL